MIPKKGGYDPVTCIFGVWDVLSKDLRAISVPYLSVHISIPDCAYEEIKLCHHIFGASDVVQYVTFADIDYGLLISTYQCKN
jgi:hypothetical protein